MNRVLHVVEANFVFIKPTGQKRCLRESNILSHAVQRKNHIPRPRETYESCACRGKIIFYKT